jgi:hypothetical protein
LQGVTEQIPAGVKGVALAGAEDLAVRGSLGERVHLGDEGDGALDGRSLLFAAILESNRRHRIGSVPAGDLPAS